MASKRRLRRAKERRIAEKRGRQCDGKNKYTSEITARKSARAVSFRKNEPLKEYPCPFCSKPGKTIWHIGHPPELKGKRGVEMPAEAR